jgi:integrase
MAATKRAPGSGHLFVRRDSAGRDNWYGKWYAEGRQRMRKIGPKRTPSGRGLDRREAERRLRKLIDEAPPPEASRVGVGEAGRALIEHLEALGRKPATIEAYDSLLRVHLEPYFRTYSLDAITVADVEGFVAARAAAGKSPKTIGNALGFLHSIFKFAKKRGWGRGNPCEHV